MTKKKEKNNKYNNKCSTKSATTYNPLTRFGLDTDTELHKNTVESLECLVELQDAVCVQIHDGVT